MTLFPRSTSGIIFFTAFFPASVKLAPKVFDISEVKLFFECASARGSPSFRRHYGAARAGINGRGERRGLTRSLAQGVFFKGKQEVNFEGGGRDPGAAALAVPTPRWYSGAIEQAELTRGL